MVYNLSIALFILLFAALLYSEKQLKNYGNFNLTVTKVDICKGPKKRDCGPYNVTTKGKSGINFDFVVKENMSPTKGKVLAISNKTEILRLQINKPCENLFLKPLLMRLFNLTNNCILRKGRYKFFLDFEEELQRYYGGMHLFGHYAFKSHFYGECNLSCTNIEVKIRGSN